MMAGHASILFVFHGPLQFFGVGYCHLPACGVGQASRDFTRSPRGVKPHLGQSGQNTHPEQ
jgi:hypothetical protein